MGAKVLRKDFLRKKRKGGKIDPQWLGPYTIAAELGKGFYSLSDLESGAIVIQRVNSAHLKLYITPSSNFSSECAAQVINIFPCQECNVMSFCFLGYLSQHTIR